MDTIAAIGTSVGQGAIGIIRLSGPASLRIIEKLYRGKKEKIFTKILSHTIHYGYIIDPSNNHKIDEVLISIMRAPYSYTREDVVEINTHGGRIVLYKILELVLHEGARLAEAGEFTKRAFLNGRIDLTQAEAIIDLINAQSEQGLSLLMNTLDGSTFDSLYLVRQKVSQWRVNIEAELNFSSEISRMFSEEELLTDINYWSEIVDTYLHSYKYAGILLNGLHLVIAGKRNVGKSSLMNRLLKKERSIVTDIPGTTTDVIEDSFYLEGILVRILDTAGFCQSKNKIEQEGVLRSQRNIRHADVIMLVLDGSQPIDNDDRYVLELIQGLNIPFFVVINKIDLGLYIKEESIFQFLNKSIPTLHVCSLDGRGVAEILRTITFFCLPDYKDNLNIGINLRQKELLFQIKESLDALKSIVLTKGNDDLLAEEFRILNRLFGEFQGDHTSSDVINEIFSRFCIGK